jgi:uncharacterized protein YndB with AHSA1/START domain
MSEVDVTTHIDASSDRVWELIGDPTRMGEWSPECRRVEWVGGATGPRLQARFRGHNRQGWRSWTTTGTIVGYEPGREIAWDVGVVGFAIAQWGYRIDPDPGGEACTVVESFRDRRGSLFQALGPVARGVKDVDAHNRVGMEQTLARIKAAAEAVSAGS